MSLQQLQTTTSSIPNGIPYQIDFNKHGLTHGVESEKKLNLLNIEPVAQTKGNELTEANKFTLIYNLAPTPVQNEILQSHVGGAVISVDDITVKCTLNINLGHEIQVELPRALFPENVNFGSPISIEMIEENGIRKPRVTLRAPNVVANQRLINQLDAIIEEL